MGGRNKHFYAIPPFLHLFVEEYRGKWGGEEEEEERVVAGEVGYANVYVTATELSSKFINGPISVPGNRINQLEGDFS